MPSCSELTSEYRKVVLTGSMRKYVMDKIKKPIMKAIITLANRFPDPTHENCLHPNTHKLMDIRDKFFEHEDNPNRKALFEAAFKLLIAEYEHDPYYRYRFDWMLEEINKSNWLSRSIYPMHGWEELERMEATISFPLESEIVSEIKKLEQPLRNLTFYDLYHPVISDGEM